MSARGTINGVSLSNFKASYTLKYLLESLVFDFYNLNDSQKRDLFDRFDKEFSEKVSMPRATFVFEDNEDTLDTKNIYFGDFNNINSGVEFIFRYLFEKRQQYQRLCVANDDKGDFAESDFEVLKQDMSKTPITKTSAYVPYSKGLKNYIYNYNKVDALLFATEQIKEVYDIINFESISEKMSMFDGLKLSFAVGRIDRFQKKVLREISKKVNSGIYKFKYLEKDVDFDKVLKEESIFLAAIKGVLDKDQKGERNAKEIFLCFNDNVWENLNETQRKKAVLYCNELISGMFECDKIKEVVFRDGKNSYDFVKDERVYVGSISKESPTKILQRLIYEYSFNKNYENIFDLDEDVREIMLRQYEECKKIMQTTNDYSKVNGYHFIKCVKDSAMDMQERVYRYIANNLVIDGKKVKMPISKEDFVLDLFQAKKRS